MKRAQLASLMLLLLAPAAAWADDGFFGLGNGHDGVFPPGGPSPNPAVVNVYMSLVQQDNANQVTVDDASSLSNGDLVLLWQAGGLAAGSSGSSSAVTIAGTSVGQRELARVTNVNHGTQQLTLTSSDTASLALANTYFSGITQVVRVPEFTTVTVASGAIAAQSWNGSTGGIVAFLASGAVQVDGSINADGAGFRGGDKKLGGIPDNNTGCLSKDLAPPDGQTRGEGVGGSIAAGLDTGFGNVANGGGGGDCSQTGGGGGGNAGKGGLGGFSAIDNNSGDPGSALNYTNYSLETQITMGGGGGAGHDKTGGATGGRDGGGAIFIRAKSLSGSGTISANGGTTQNGSSADDGQGGGGAGGSLYIRLNGACSSVAMHVDGSDGVDAPNGNVGAGGGGGGGRSFQQASVVCGGVTHAKGNHGGSGHGGAADGVAGTSEAAPSGVYCTSDNATAPCGGALVCEPHSNSCVQCVDDSTCPGQHCDPVSFTCKACVTDAHCPTAANPTCTSFSCDNSCDSRSGTFCSTKFPSTDAFCEGSGGLHGQCVQCLASTDCANSAPVCNGSDVCVGCTGTSDCNGRANATKCLTPGVGTGQCVECLGNADCPGSKPICNGSNQCVVCTSTGQDSVCSTNHPGTNFCDAGGTGACVACRDNTQCTAGSTTPFCDTSSTHTCVGCAATDSRCNGNANGNACQPSGSCSQCRTGNTGACGGGTPLCELTSGKCVACLSDTNCTANSTAPHCDTASTFTCIGCSGSDTNCSGNANGGACQPNGSCRLCRSGSTGACTGGTSQCDTVTGACVECLSNANCTASSNKPFCDTSGNSDTCVSCGGNDARCSGNANGGACQADGTCKECSGTNFATCTAASKVVGSSRVDLQACKLEYSIVSPK